MGYTIYFVVHVVFVLVDWFGDLDPYRLGPLIGWRWQNYALAFSAALAAMAALEREGRAFFTVWTSERTSWIF